MRDACTHAPRSTREPRARCAKHAIAWICHAAVSHRGKFGTERVEGTRERRILLALINCLLWTGGTRFGKDCWYFSLNAGVRLFGGINLLNLRYVFQSFTFRSSLHNCEILVKKDSFKMSIWKLCKTLTLNYGTRKRYFFLGNADLHVFFQESHSSFAWTLEKDGD